MNLAQAIKLIYCLAFSPQERSNCESTIDRNVAIIERIAPEYGVSPEIIAGICIKESRLGADTRAASVCGTRLHHRYIADAETSIRITANTLSRHHCRNLPLSISSFRGYGCSRSSYATEVLSIQRRILCTMSSSVRCGGRHARVQARPHRTPQAGQVHRASLSTTEPQPQSR